VGEWERGRGGEWESGRVGEWESGRVGEWESGRVGEWESAVCDLVFVAWMKRSVIRGLSDNEHPGLQITSMLFALWASVTNYVL